MPEPNLEMWRLPRLLEKTGLGKDTIYTLMREGEFPRPFALSPNTVGWRSDEVVAWMETRQRIPARDAAA